MCCSTSTICARFYTCVISSLPVVNQPQERCAAQLEQLARRMRRQAEEALAPLGLRPRHFVTLTLLRDSDGMTQQTLADTLQMDRTNLVGLLNELEGDDLVERRRSTEDRRRHIVELTTTGRRRLADAEFSLAAAEDRVLSALGARERATLGRLLAKAAGDLPAVLPPGAC